MKNILITGCSSGFGFNAAKYLAQKGHHIHATMRNTNGKNAKAASELKDFASSNQLQIDVVDMDVTSDDSVNAAVAKMAKVEVLINNAGYGYVGPIEAFSSKIFMDQLDLNIIGPFRVAKAVLPLMRAQKYGLIIQVSSVAGRSASPAYGIYHASKWGLEGLSESLRYELSSLGIDVVIVEPGPFDTNFLDNLVMPKDEKVAMAYKHVKKYLDAVIADFRVIFKDKNKPIEPMLVAKAFEKLINTPDGKRPLRTVVGMGDKVRALNDAYETIRKANLESLGIAEWDGPKPQDSPSKKG